MLNVGMIDSENCRIPKRMAVGRNILWGMEYDEWVCSWVHSVIIPSQVIGCVVDSDSAMLIDCIILDSDGIAFLLREVVVITIKFVVEETSKKMVFQFRHKFLHCVHILSAEFRNKGKEQAHLNCWITIVLLNKIIQAKRLVSALRDEMMVFEALSLRCSLYNFLLFSSCQYLSSCNLLTDLLRGILLVCQRIKPFHKTMSKLALQQGQAELAGIPL